MFDRYAKLINEMNKFEKDDILNKKFELHNQSNMKIYYAPHNEIINKKAKVFIVGITPGWTQTSIAYKTAHEGLVKGLDYEQIKKEQCLFGFPHPSGANGHRKKQFEENKVKLLKVIEEYF